MKDSARAPGFSGRLVGLPKCLLHARLAVASTLRASISSPVIGMQAIHHVHTCRFLLFSAWLICGLTYCVLCGVWTRVVSFCFGCGSPSSPTFFVHTSLSSLHLFQGILGRFPGAAAAAPAAVANQRLRGERKQSSRSEEVRRNGFVLGGWARSGELLQRHWGYTMRIMSDHRIVSE